MLDEITFGEGKLNNFSTSGCKKLSQRVSFLITKYGLRKFSEEDKPKKEKKWSFF